MKKFIFTLTLLLMAIIQFGQINKIDTSFYSLSLSDTMLVDVYFPPGYDDHPDWYYPVIYSLPAWLSSQNEMGLSYLSSLQEHISDNLIDPVIMVCANNNPPPFLGSMYVNSELYGNYEDYNINDLVEWVEASFRAIPERNARGMIGQSMGAYGAFRYGIQYKSKFRAFAAHAALVSLDKDLLLDAGRQQVMLEHPQGSPYFYDYSSDGQFTKLFFLMSGGFSPDTNSLQTYISPQVVNYLFDENADYIDSVYQKWLDYDISQMIQQLTPEDSVGILFGCGENDGLLLYPSNLAFTDTLEMLGLPYEFYSHGGGHNMPPVFRNRAYIFLDSLLMPPGPYTGIQKLAEQKTLNVLIFPNPASEIVHFEFEIENPSPVRIMVFNALGDQVAVLSDGTSNEGIQQVIWNAASLPAGLYFCEILIGQELVTRKIVKL
jgi:S-formylglutathione hydrolase FrmB